MEMASMHGINNNNITDTKHRFAKKSFEKYIDSVNTSDPNQQVLQQFAELQKMLQEIKTKEKKKMANLERQIIQEASEIETIRERIMAVTKTKEQPESNEQGKFRTKYIIFCTCERKNMCELLGSADKTCTILKECYFHCEQKHKNDKMNMVKDQFISTKSNQREIEDISHLQKQYAAKTSKCLLTNFKSKSSPTDTLWTTYSQLSHKYGQDKIDPFIQKSFEVCWTMVSETTPMTFCYDKHIAEDKNDYKFDLKEKPIVEVHRKNTSMKKTKAKANAYLETSSSNPMLELKYPAVLQGQAVIAKGLRQKKIF